MPTLKRRITARDNKFGKAPEELAAILGWHADYEEIYRGFGAVVIDATRPLEQVVGEVLAEAAGTPT